MSYLETLAGTFDEILRTRGLTEAQREEITAFVKEKVLESFRNGLEKGRAKAQPHQKTTAPGNRKPTRKGPARKTQ